LLFFVDAHPAMLRMYNTELVEVPSLSHEEEKWMN
jgi:hypothetical protein